LGDQIKKVWGEMMSLISTIKASCRDCYKCVRCCPVKAIRVISSHAEVVEDRCIGDGRCVTICPQQAKKIESSVNTVSGYLKAGYKVAVSLAPSFAVAFDSWKPGQVISALKSLGFSYVEETAEGAELVAQQHLALVKQNTGSVITSCCPAVVKLIELYYPELTKNLAPVVSPMVAHGAILKQRYGKDTKVVFIGPCIAKKEEAQHFDSVDAVLTFFELMQLINENRIYPGVLPDGKFDGPGAKLAQVFPSPGGLAKTAMLSTDLLAKDVITIDGLEETISFLDNFQQVSDSYKLIELLACRGGCIAGPGIPSLDGLYSKREKLLSYAETRRQDNNREEAGSCDYPNITRSFAPVDPEPVPSNEQIAEILARTGKFKLEDELNCGACGYNSCREKAIAVAKGMAEVNMCIPYMRAKAESRANLICNMTPNAIFVVTKDLRILEVNPAAERKFLCKQEQVVGSNLGTIINPKYFEEAIQTKQVVTGEVSYPAYGLVAWQAIFYVENEEVVIGIFADITREKQQREKLDRMTVETLGKAQEVINKQMRVAQEIAGLLGETTAETKVQLTKLMKLIDSEAGKGR